MAQLLRVQVTVLLGLLALSISATARPCRTFFISSYSFSIPATDRNPSSASLTTFTEIHSFIPLRITDNAATKPYFPTEIFFSRSLPARPIEEVHIDQHRRETTPFGFSAYDFSSLRDRTKDILSVVVALLFGVGCGALTAAAMYLVWSLFANRYDYRDDYVDDEIESPKKVGYVKIPVAEEAVIPAPPVKEAV